MQRVWLRVRVGMALRFPISASTAAAGAMGSPGHKGQAVWPPGHLCCSAPRSRPAAQHAAWVPVKAKPMPKRGFLHLCTGDQGCRGDTLVSTGASEDLCFPRVYSHSARCSFHRSDQTFLQISSAQDLGGGGDTWSRSLWIQLWLRPRVSVWSRGKTAVLPFQVKANGLWFSASLDKPKNAKTKPGIHWPSSRTPGGGPLHRFAPIKNT